MKPRLVVIAGSLEGHQFELGASVFTIGRHATNRLRIMDISVSRQHCTIEGNPTAFLLTDLESRRGTFVNGVPINQRELIHGDLIEIGNAKLVFLCDEITSDRKSISDENDDPGVTTACISLDEVVYLQPEKPSTASSSSARAGRALKSLLLISKLLTEIRDVEELARNLLKHFLDVMPVERAALVFHESGEMASEAVFTDKRGLCDRFSINRNLIERVSRQRIGVLFNESAHQDEFLEKSGIRADRIRALVCVPLFGPSRCLGVLYGDQQKNATLMEDQLQLATAIACIAAAPLENAFFVRTLERENRRLREDELRHDMIGESAAMKKIYPLIQRVAGTEATILIRGESGTGKELAARAIHRNSTRAAKPFIAINCAVLSETLLNSELFGHERGAFTGAVARKIGKLELAHTGTLFLDEVGELPPSIQAKLLRVLQEREFERLGGNQTIKVNLRVLAATNRDLENAMSAGQFREDLYYRLNVISLTMPPLRERSQDILLLAAHFAAKFARTLNRPVFGISSWAKTCLNQYDWPGNVRELSNAIERAVVLGEDQLIRMEDLPENLREKITIPTNASPANYQAALNRVKRDLIRNAMAQTEGNITKAAALLDLHPNYLHRLIRNLELRDEIGRESGVRKE